MYKHTTARPSRNLRIGGTNRAVVPLQMLSRNSALGVLGMYSYYDTRNTCVPIYVHSLFAQLPRPERKTSQLRQVTEK